MEIREPKSFEDLLYLQSILDKEVAKARENGFTPRERNADDIILSIIAELIEFDEELSTTHKTWKQKEFNKENAIIESVDVLFFFLQYINYLKDKEIGGIKKLIENLDFNKINFFRENKDFYYVEVDSFFINNMISFLLNGLLESFFFKLCRAYVFLGMTKEDILYTYWEKWQKNMQRINGDWSINHEKD